MQDDFNDWFAPESATFGDRLVAARDIAGLTQEAFARRLGVRIDTVRAWENDRSEPRANRLSMMAGLMNVSIMWLLNGEGAGPENPDSSPDTGTAAADALSELRALRTELGDTLARLDRVERQLEKAAHSAG